MHRQLSYAIQDLLHRSVITHCELGPATSVSSREKAPTEMLTDQSDEGNSSSEVLSSYVKLTAKISHYSLPLVDLTHKHITVVKL